MNKFHTDRKNVMIFVSFVRARGELMNKSNGNLMHIRAEDLYCMDPLIHFKRETWFKESKK